MAEVNAIGTTCETGTLDTGFKHMLHDRSLARDIHWNTFGHLSITMHGLTNQQQMHMLNHEDEPLHLTRAQGHQHHINMRPSFLSRPTKKVI